VYRLKVQREKKEKRRRKEGERLETYGREGSVLSFLPSAPLTVNSCRVYIYATKLVA
jgi:hypothetical protein